MSTSKNAQTAQFCSEVMALTFVDSCHCKRQTSRSAHQTAYAMPAGRRGAAKQRDVCHLEIAANDLVLKVGVSSSEPGRKLLSLGKGSAPNSIAVRCSSQLGGINAVRS